MPGMAMESDLPGVGEPRSLRVGDWVYKRLREGILLGDFVPGQRLRQSEIADRFEVSQTPVREALGRLASDGLVTLQPHRGAVVNRLSGREIDEIYELREVLDPHVAGRAATCASEPQIKAIRAAAEACAEAGISATELFDRNRLFHRALYEACGNRRMIQLFRWLWDSVTAIRMFDVYASDEAGLERMNREHREIAEAIAAHDSELAADLVRSHTATARAEILGLIPEGLDADDDQGGDPGAGK
jgi:DNA-binding GntR family transcriptional regulator